MKIVLVDDDRIVRQALKTILEKDPDNQVVALGANYEEALCLYDQHLPDVLLLDIRMGEKTGLDAAEDILQRHPQAHILFLTTFADDEYIRRALQLGAKGYILKQDYDAIGPALKAIASGQSVFGKEIVDALPHVLKPAPARHTLSELSEREQEVLRLIAEGYSNREIAGTLYLSEGTVRNYVSVLLQKLEVRDRTQLVIHYYKGL